MKKVGLCLAVLMVLVNRINAQNITTEFFHQFDTIQTYVYDSKDNLPLVGGVIRYCKQPIVGKYLIVSTNGDDIQLRSGVPYDSPYFYSKETNKPLNYRIIDCTHVNKEQFFCHLMALKPNTDYYIRACIEFSDGRLKYGDKEYVKTPDSYSRMNTTLDKANVWNKDFRYTTFDLMTDEIINVDKGFIYTSNEEPTPKVQMGRTGMNTCCKFANEWNYMLWLTHTQVYEKDIVKEPIITRNGDYITIVSDYDVFYEINPTKGTTPKKYSQHYTKPFKIKNEDVVKAYAIDKKTNNISFTNVYVAQPTDNQRRKLRKVGNRSMPSQSELYYDDSECETNLWTLLHEKKSGFPSVGGTLQAWENVVRKYLVVSTRKTNMNVNDGDGTPLTANPSPSQLTILGKSYEGTVPFEYCIIDCCTLTVDEFKAIDINFLPLDPNKKYFARPCVVYKNGYSEYGRVRPIIYNK